MPSPSLADLAALGKLFETHSPRLLTMLERRLDPRLRRHVDAGTILNDAFLLAHQKWSEFRAKCSVSPFNEEEFKTTAFPWLYGLARNALINAWRKQFGRNGNRRGEIGLSDAASVDLGSRLCDRGTPPVRAAARAEIKARVRDAMQVLDEQDQDILWMRHYDDLKFGEIAEVLNIKENAANVRYFRAMEKLRNSYLQSNGKPSGSE